MEEQKQIRCAIYTRKSTDEGLEKEFNTLEAQREAGENFVMSMKHQGWVILPDHYDDGGFSGGTLKHREKTKEYTRGTVLKVSGDALTICGASDTPEAILAEAVDATSEDKQAVIYLTGEFNSAAMTVAGGASADGLKAKLRAKNIFIKTNQAY